MLLFTVFLLLPLTLGEFNPFSDDDLFAINWAGPTDLDSLKAVSS